MAVAAEQIYQFQTFETPQPFEAPQPPALALVVPELAEDVFTRHQAERFIGRVMLDRTVEAIPEASKTSTGSLYDAVQRAYEGDAVARQLIATNVRTDVVERTIKAGHITAVELDVDAQGKLRQFGQTMESIQANSLAYAADQSVMRARSEAEVRNSFRIENLHRQGLLQDYAFVVFSRAADDMSPADMVEAGFFTDTMSCAIQLTTASEAGLSLESAFVAGVARPGQARHDADAVAAVAERLGVELGGQSATELLDTPLLIHKSLLPNGVVDLVQLYDEAAGGTFFGEAKPGSDYLEYRAACQQREAGFAPKVAAIVAKLIAAAPAINTPVAAVQRLHTLSEQHMVEQAVGDRSINPMVFGRVAAAHIAQARAFQELGQLQQAQGAIAKAQTTATSSSCPTAMKVSKKDALGQSDDVTDTETDTETESDETVRMTCPFCGDKNQSGKRCSPNQHCTNCDARVTNGRVVSKGDGGKKKAAAKDPAQPRRAETPQLKDAVLMEEQRRKYTEAASQRDTELPPEVPQSEAHLGKLAIAA